MKILLPVDGTYESVYAAKTALEIAKKADYSIKMINVIRPGELHAYKRYSRLWQYADGSFLDENTRLIDGEEAKRRMEKRASGTFLSILNVVDTGDVKIETEVLFGKSSSHILKTAKEDMVDLIVMGDKGFSKIKRFFTGSITQEVITKAPCPVLVVRDDTANKRIVTSKEK